MAQKKRFSKKSHSKKVQSPQEELGFSPKINEAGEVRVLLSWEAPVRPFRKKDKSYYFTSGLIVILLAVILLLMNEFLLIAVILSLLFVTYVLAFVPPGDVLYRISTQGVTIGENFYFWHLLDSFWFKEKEGHKILIIQTMFNFPAQLMLVLGSEDEEKVKKIVARFLPFMEVPYKSMTEKWSEGLQKNFPLERVKK